MSEVNLGLDRSGNNNHWAVVNMTLAVDQVVDSPTNNFATLNPLGGLQTSTITFSEGNLKASNAAGGTEPIASSTIAMTSGKWYFEYRNLSGDGSVGIQDTNNAGQSYIYHDNQGGFGSGYYYNGSLRATDGQDANYGAAWGNTDIIGVALDVDNGTLVFYKNNASQGTAETGLPSSASLGYRFVISTDSCTAMANFGQDSSFAGNSTAQGNQDGNDIGDFYYAPPSGYLALCTKNLPEPAVDPRNHFSQLLYTGDDSTDNDITGIGFETDFLWIKRRDATAQHYLFDSLRLYDNGHNKQIFSSLDGAEGADDSGSSNSRVRLGVITDGFNLTSTDTDLNASAGSYVAWNWKAGNANTAFTESGNNPGGIHRANVAAGFSIVSYVGTGAAGTVAHGLGAAPEWIFIKNRGVADAWAVYYGDNTDYLVLDTNAATADAATYFNDTSPSATVFTVNTAHNVNADGENYIAYCWRSIDGHSKLGSYIGNGNADGTFTYTGFRPACVFFKGLSTNHWSIKDIARNPDNLMDKTLLPTVNNAEETNREMDFTSNGFKQRDATSGDLNDDGVTYIYMAFAETPFKYANAK